MQIIVETFRASGENSGSNIRVRPLPGQGFSPAMRVECSKAMRSAFPIGQLFCVWVSVKSKEGGPDFLYSYHGDPWSPITPTAAATFIKNLSHLNR
jgi:hypothetical protein